MKKMITFLFILFVALNINARNMETMYGIDNNFVKMTYIEITQGLSLYNDDTMNDMGIVPFNIRYGVLNNMELGIKIPYIFQDNSKNGLGDISIFQKFKFVEETINAPVISGGFEFNLPTGDLDNNESVKSHIYQYDNEKIDFKFFLAGAKDLPNFRLFSSIGLDFLNGADDTKFDYNIGINYIVNEKFNLTTEMFGFSVSSDYMESEMYVAPAILLSPNENLNVKLGIPIGITSESYDYRVDLSMEHTF